MLSNEVKSVANFIAAKLKRSHSAARRWKMTKSCFCDNREPSPSTYGVTEVEVFEIAVTVEEGIKMAHLKDIFSEGDSGGRKPINILRFLKTLDHGLPPTLRYSSGPWGIQPQRF